MLARTLAFEKMIPYSAPTLVLRLDTGVIDPTRFWTFFGHWVYFKLKISRVSSLELYFEEKSI